MKPCPCGSNKRYMECCGAFIQGNQHAPTPEALMRSRYSAFVENKLNYIKKTMREPALSLFKKSRNNDEIQWIGLEVIAAPAPTLNPNNLNVGFVEFKAHYQKEGVSHCIHENSEFHHIDGRWYYVDGTHFD